MGRRKSLASKEITTEKMDDTAQAINIIDKLSQKYKNPTRCSPRVKKVQDENAQAKPAKTSKKQPEPVDFYEFDVEDPLKQVLFPKENKRNKQKSAKTAQKALEKKTPRTLPSVYDMFHPNAKKQSSGKRRQTGHKMSQATKKRKSEATMTSSTPISDITKKSSSSSGDSGVFLSPTFSLDSVESGNSRSSRSRSAAAGATSTPINPPMPKLSAEETVDQGISVTPSPQKLSPVAFSDINEDLAYENGSYETYNKLFPESPMKSPAVLSEVNENRSHEASDNVLPLSPMKSPIVVKSYANVKQPFDGKGKKKAAPKKPVKTEKKEKVEKKEKRRSMVHRKMEEWAEECNKEFDSFDDFDLTIEDES